jgi:hypothetical protein
MKSKIIVCTLVALALTACSKKDDKGSQASTNVTSGVTSNLQQIQTSFTPTSMASSTTALQSGDFKMLTAGTGPCANMDFFQCQSVLVKLYFDIGKAMVGTAAQLVSGVGSHLGQLADGASGTANSNDGGTVEYSKTSPTVFSVLAKNASATPGLYLSVNDTTYTMKFDIKTLDATETDDVKLEMTINYTSATVWSIDLYMSNSTCDAADPGAPGRIKIVLSRNDTLWTGKAMLFHPHWTTTSTPTCSDTTTIGMYTDFVGSNTATKGSLYMIPGTNNDLSSISNLEFADFCTNFGSACVDAGTGGTIPNDLPANYLNPFCSITAGVAPSFNNTCSASDSAVSAAAYSAASIWITPFDLSNLAITLPSALTQ